MAYHSQQREARALEPDIGKKKEDLCGQPPVGRRPEGQGAAYPELWSLVTVIPGLAQGRTC